MFRVQDTITGREIFNAGFFLINFDLKSAYQHIEILEEHRKYLGFHWEHWENSEKYYVFNVLPFGISSLFILLSY